MKYFNSIKRTFENIGIYRNQAFENQSINWKSATILLILAQNIVFAAIFLLFEAKTFGEYSESFYYIVTLIINFLIIGEFVRKTWKTNELITNFENTIQKRNYFST